MNSFFSKHNLLVDQQHGFRQGRSTETALLTQKELIIRNIEENKITLGIFIDYSKAFDYLDHNILLSKLSDYGIRGVTHTLLLSYLSDRKQRVAIENCVSEYKSVLHGVPQGSVLGPLLFNVYVNDIVKTSSDASFVLYADDTSLFVSGSNSEEVFTKAQVELQRLYTWSKSNGLKINSNKSKAILFRAKNKEAQIHAELLLGGMPISIVEQHKILGVTFSADMTWTCHVESLTKSLSSVAGALSRCRHFLPVRVKLQIYHALFSSRVNYCTLVWGTTTIKNINSVLTVQKRALRYIENVSYTDSTRLLFSRHKIISAKHTYEYRLLFSFFFSNEKFKTFLKASSDLKIYESDNRTRGSDRWLVPRRRTGYMLQSLKHNVPFLLNIYDNALNSDACTRKAMREYFVNIS